MRRLILTGFAALSLSLALPLPLSSPDWESSSYFRLGKPLFDIVPLGKR